MHELIVTTSRTYVAAYADLVHDTVVQTRQLDRCLGYNFAP